MENKQESTNQDIDRFDVEINAQYLKDLSFENPGAPLSLIQKETPQIGLDVNINVQKFEEKNFEVVLNITATAKDSKENVIFMVSIAYAGLFDLSAIPEEYHRSVLVMYCPSLLFPYARAIISDSVRDGGFPPLLLKPIDFSKLYNVEDNSANLN